MARMMTKDEAEWGRELWANDLTIKTVVILSRDGLTGVTAWVTLVGIDFATFTMGVIKTTLILRRLADGTMVDDTQKQVRVFEYEGEV